MLDLMKVATFIVASQLYVCTHFLVTSISHSSTKEQKHGTEILHKLNLVFWWNTLNRKYKDIKKKLDLSAIIFSTLVLIVHTINDETNIVNKI